MDESASRLPIAVFVIALVGVIFFYWHGQISRQARQLELAATQELQTNQLRLQQKIEELRTQQPNSRIEYEEVRVPVTEISAKPAAGVKGDAPASKPEMKTTTRILRIPRNVSAGNTAAAQEVNTASQDLRNSQAAATAAQQSAVAANDVFGVNREVVALIFSVLILAASLYVILNKKYPPGTEKWAFGSVGTILGHWFAS